MANTKARKELRTGTTGETLKEEPPENKPVQDKLNQLIWDHGNNLPNRAEWPERLKEAGLVPAEITVKMLRKAESASRQRAAGNLSKVLADDLIWLKPYREEQEAAWWTVWWTECRRYRVVRSVSKLSEGDNGYRVSAVKGTQLPNNETIVDVLSKTFRTLEGAFLAAEDLYCSQTGAGTVRTNRKIRLLEANRDELDVLPKIETKADNVPQTQTDEESEMYVEETTARKVLAAAGVPGADDPEQMTVAKLLKRCNDLPNLEGVHEPETEEEARVYKKMHAALSNGKAITFELKDKLRPAGKQQNGKAPKAAAKAKKEKNPNAPKKEGAAKDKFGSRIGSDTAKINACLSKKTKNMSELLKESGLEGTRYNHMNKLIEAGYVIKDGNGYKLKG